MSSVATPANPSAAKRGRAAAMSALLVASDCSALRRGADGAGSGDIDIHTACMLDTYCLYVKARTSRVAAADYREEPKTMPELRLPQGTIRYRDEGSGP